LVPPLDWGTVVQKKIAYADAGYAVNKLTDQQHFYENHSWYVAGSVGSVACV